MQKDLYKNTVPQQKAEKPPVKTDTTLWEFLAWLRRRSQLRRRYALDTVRKSTRRQLGTAIVYWIVLTYIMASCMTIVQLQKKDTFAVQASFMMPMAYTANPALHAEDIACTVSVQLGNAQAVTWQTPSETVEDILSDMGISLGDDDIVNVPLDTIAEDGMEILITQVTCEVCEETVSLPYETEYVDVQTIPRGSTVRISYGTDGVAKQSLRRRYENGVLVETTVLSSETLYAPVNEKMYRGIGGYVGGNRFSYYIDVTATAYGGEEFSGLTYTGTQVRKGVIAVDPNIIPLGSKVYVKGDYGDYGVCYAEDIGGGIKDYHIDIYMENATYEEMREFGIRKMRVYFLE